MLTPSPRVANLALYKPKKARPGITLRLDSNEGCAPPQLLDQVSELSPAVLSQYPNAGPLEARLAARLGVANESLLVTAGADDALDRICRALLAPGRNIVLPTPTFEMLPRYAALAGGSVQQVPWLRGPFPTEAVLSVTDDTTAAVAVVSPNNPTGGVARGEDLVRLREGLAPSVLLIVDLAYGEVADVDLGPVAAELPSTVVVRTLSKAWGLAGLRVGYCAGPLQVIDWLRRVGNPYAVASPSLALAALQLDDDSHMRAYVARIRAERSALFAVLDELGAAPLPSQGNFVLCEPASATALCEGLAERGIAVRGWPDDKLLSRFVRISCPGDESQLPRLLTALGEVLSS